MTEITADPSFSLGLKQFPSANIEINPLKLSQKFIILFFQSNPSVQVKIQSGHSRPKIPLPLRRGKNRRVEPRGSPVSHEAGHSSDRCNGGASKPGHCFNLPHRRPHRLATTYRCLFRVLFPSIILINYQRSKTNACLNISQLIFNMFTFY